MINEVLTLQFVEQELNRVTRDLEAGDMLQARERLALVVAALDRVTYPNG
jgi:hypothetical protein